MADEIAVELAGHRFAATLFANLAPLACQALVARLPLEGPAIHAMWSGPLYLLNGVDLGDLPVENATTYLGPGDLVYHPRHKEIGVAYEPTQFKEPVGPVYVTLLGQLAGDLGALVEVGRRLQYTGAQRLVVRRA